MNDPLLMAVIYSKDDLFDDLARFNLRQTLIGLNILNQLSPISIFHYEDSFIFDDDGGVELDDGLVVEHL
jgi:hypothetical protein